MNGSWRKVLLAVLFAVALACTACSSGGGSASDANTADVELYPLHLAIDYDSNLLFAIYDVEVLIDGESVGSISQGNQLVKDVQAAQGKHTLAFQKKGSSSTHADIVIDMTAESYYACTLKAHSSEIDIANEVFEASTEHDARVAAETADRERQEAQQAAAEEEEKHAAAELDGCVGKKASAAKKIAQDQGYSVSFLDSDAWDVTDFYGAAAKGAAVRKAKVTRVDAREFLGSKSVDFTLDYTFPTEDSLKGKELSEACTLLEKHGIGYRIVGATTGDDLTSAYQAGDFADSAMVIEDADVRGADAFAELSVLSQERVALDAQHKATKQQLEDKLGVVDSWYAVQSYGKGVYGSDFKVHFIIGAIAEEAWDEDTWFLKAECDVHGESGYMVEAKVTGTSDNPVVVDFFVY